VTRLQQIVKRLRSLDLWILLSLLIVIGGTWGFIELLDEVHEGETQIVDEWAIRAIGGYNAPAWLEEVGRDLTALGGIAILSMATAAISGYLLIAGKRHAMVLLLASTLGALIISFVLKDLIDRPRPDLVEHRSHVMTQSFPSGHSMLSAAVYLTLGALLARLTNSWVLKCYFIGFALLLTGMVGISRVFLGVHWPTDVLAGWTAGLVWALACWGVARYLQLRGQVEKPD
jgi:undecaprenyl-diphosphatase